jgi:cytoskeleton protein RodZ
MDQGVGSILHAARNRREIELSEVESTTRIRLRYLRAIENEEWDVLPGEVYARGFIRTYATFLGLDGERLVSDYRESVEGSRRGQAEPLASSAAGPSPAGRYRDRLPAPLGSLIVIAVVVAAAIVAIVAIPTVEDGGHEGPTGAGSPLKRRPAAGDRAPAAQRQRPSGGVSVRLAANAEVWVCVLDAGGEALVNGQILEAGAEAGPFRSGSFTVSFGNGEVSMLIDGREAEIPATSSPIGYSIDSSGALTQLSETERPTCT